MRSTDLAAEFALRAFAVLAAARFAENKDLATFGEIGKGEYLALRWGMGGDCVLIIRQCENFEPVNFQQAIRRAP